MKLELFNKETQKVWKSISGNASNDLMPFEIQLYRKLLVYFQLGQSCFFIFNFQRLAFDHVSEEVEALLGYRVQDITSSFLLENVHPQDRGWFLACQDHATQFSLALPADKKMKYKVQYDLRLKKSNGQYAQLILQTVVIHTDEDGRIIRTLTVLTDISHIKKQGAPCLSYIGMENEPCYMDVDLHYPYLDKGPKTAIAIDGHTKQEKYGASTLPKARLEAYAMKLQKGFTEEKWYLIHELNLKMLAGKTGIPAHSISLVINKCFGKSFSGYVNAFRVEAFMQKATDPTYDNITVESLLYMCGFNSKAAFYRLFKKYAGMSPRQYYALSRKGQRMQ